MRTRRRDGFTIIELLTVIAIIGILAALVFPIASSSRRKAAQAQCINNMYQIFTALKQFQLDEHRYPDFIAGPVQYDGGGNVIPLEDSTGIVNGQTVSLYPEYIDAVSILKCPSSDTNGQGVEYSMADFADDPLFGLLNAPPPPGEPRSLRSQQPFQLYCYSSYDYQFPSEGMQGAQVHYAPLWFYVDDPANVPVAIGLNYERQLWWRVPPTSTVVTWCSYHRYGSTLDNCKEPVLFLDGHVRVMTSTPFDDWTLAWRVPRPS